MLASISEALDSFAIFDVQTSILGSLVCLVWLYSLIRKHPDFPPGPSWRAPLLGHLREFTKHKDFRKLRRIYRERYGQVYSFYLGRRLVVIISGLDAIREAFVKRADEFSDRPSTIVQKARAKGHGLNSSNGYRLTIPRTATLNALRSLDSGTRPLEATMHEEIAMLLEDFGSYDNTAFNPKRDLMTSVSNVTCSIIFGTKYNRSAPDLWRMVTLTGRLSTTRGSASLLNFLPYLQYLPGDFFKFKEFQNVLKELNAFFEERIQACKNRLDDNNTDDFVTAFIKTTEQEAIKDGNDTRNNTDFDLKVLIGDLFGAGLQTTAATLCSALQRLVNYPELQNRVFQEIDEHVGQHRLPCMSDRHRLVYTEAFIMETQRLANLNVLSRPHTAKEDIMFRGYMIPKEAMIFPDIQSVLSDPELWTDPDVFRPERFISDDGELVTPEGFIPFFVGQRNCIGEQLTKMELFLFFSSLVQKFQFYSPDDVDLNMEKPDVDSGGIHVPEPFCLHARSRNWEVELVQP